MIFVDNEHVTDARVNLAIEEYLALHAALDEDILLLYLNAPSIIIGRNQNTLAEINAGFVEERGIRVVRRLSGGGAVYHDLGNLNFCFITRYRTGDFRNFRKFTAPVIRTLRELGIPAELSGRSDIVVRGRKISGNAQYRGKQRMITHGTLLFDSDLDAVSAALHVNETEIDAKGIKSVRSQVANISEFLDQPMDIQDLKARLLQGIFAGVDPIPSYRLTSDDWAKIHELSATRYATWEWNYGKSLAFSVCKRHRFHPGEIAAYISTHRGVIKEIKLRGDFFSEQEASELEDRLTGVRFDSSNLQLALAEIDLPSGFENIDVRAFVDYLLCYSEDPG